MTDAGLLGILLLILFILIVGYFIRYGTLGYPEDMYDEDDPFPPPKGDDDAHDQSDVR